MKFYHVITLGFIFGLMGCGSTKPAKIWSFDIAKDKFNDKKECTVTTARIYSENATLHPFIKFIDDETTLGVKSAGSYKIPVGNIQLRIDKNAPYTIKTSETPVSLIVELENPYVDAMKNLPEDQQKIAIDAFVNASKTAAQIQAPYTATSGDKLINILNEMKIGSELIYRQVGLANITSTLGRTPLDASFHESLNFCNRFMKLDI
jgi:LysM repeat protein